MFHLNDADHGDWSPAHLASLQDAIEHKCGDVTACLAPYAPTGTIVRRGTYYAFQPGNDVHEYAAETALRYYRENRAVDARRAAGPAGVQVRARREPPSLGGAPRRVLRWRGPRPTLLSARTTTC